MKYTKYENDLRPNAVLMLGRVIRWTYFCTQVADLLFEVIVPKVALQRVDEQREADEPDDDLNRPACRAVALTLERMAHGDVPLDREAEH